MTFPPSPKDIAAAFHYPTSAERLADWWVHAVGLAASAIGGGTLLGLALGLGRYGEAASVAIYAAGVMVMFACSAAYNMSAPGRQPLLRRFDHAAIFVMIAGSYTPFTTQRLEGAWSIGMTAAVWAIALTGVAGKLFMPGLSKKIWVVIYLALGWIALIAIKPLSEAAPLSALLLLALGGVVYSTGVLVYVSKQLRFRRAIWHGFVVTAAALHFVAVLTGVILPAS
ncbi:MAG: PAQR family membrane homeostasis protein TrhA [Caulobacteraceae bacterium]